MLLDGNSRGGGSDLARHLMKPENERIEIIEIRGFVSDDLKGAFLESYAISKGTRCKQHLFSMSIDPPIGADIDDDDYVDAANRVEAKLSLTNQPRTIVRHWKRGKDGVVRAHAHSVWCRIDASDMKAIDLPFSKLKLREVSRELHIEHNLPMPRGLINYQHRDPRNFTLAQWQHAKRNKRDFHQVQSDFMDAWALSDNRSSFAHALQERGYILASGERGFVAVDHEGKVYAARQYAGVRRSKDLAAKLGDTIGLPSVEQAQKMAAQHVTERLAELRREQATESVLNRAYARRESERAESNYERQQDSLRERQARQKEQQEKRSVARLRGGIFGLWDRLTGRHQQTVLLNKSEQQTLRKQQAKEIRTLRDQHLTKVKAQQDEARLARSKHYEAMKELRQDMTRLREPPKELTKKAPRKARSTERPQRHSRSRHGPRLER